MTIQEKAVELYDKFVQANKKYLTSNQLFSERQNGKLNALICVDEIIEIAKGSHDEDMKKWWQDVKSELEKF